MIEDDELAGRLAKAARDKVIASYTAAAVSDRIAATFSEVLAKRLRRNEAYA